QTITDVRKYCEDNYGFDLGNLRYSVGVGIRWKSPIGPIRLDVASGISDDNHPIRLHFFIGPQL
ncbi:surface antigen family protein, partial [Acinetobacter baumannii 25691_8]|uniref:BamA/TamA family outer membrane protein n=1 Tax=Acinetobacter baumannii TaxID=470 RepID=UPI00049F17A4